MSATSITFTDFTESPWKNEHLHPAYKNSFLNFSNVPEYGPSEMLLASLYRRIGLRQEANGRKGGRKTFPESEVGKKGTVLTRTIEKRVANGKTNGSVSVEGWQRVLEEVIRSPKTPKQGKSNFIQTTPLVPSAAIYSMAPRLRGNSWNPGSLIESSLCLGASCMDDANNLWKRLFEALSVKELEDDVWAVFLEEEFSVWSDGDVEWAFAGKLCIQDWMVDWQSDGIPCPARRFAKDLMHLIGAKAILTRRQWTSAVEAILRIGLGSHVLWVSKVNQELFSLAEEVLGGDEAPTPEKIRERLSTGDGFCSYGQLVGAHIKKLVRSYMYGRVGLNMLLYRCQEVPKLKALVAGNPFGSVEAIQEFLAKLEQCRSGFDLPMFQESLDTALDTDPRKLAIKHGTGKNIEEYLRHTLGQRETQERGLESYDQGYLLSRRSSYARAPWVLGAGPVMILALVYSCTSEGSGIRTVEDLCKHLGEYGVKINPDEVADTKLGHSLRTLGLVLDSPDAEGGMVLLDPFSAYAGSNHED